MQIKKKNFATSFGLCILENMAFDIQDTSGKHNKILNVIEIVLVAIYESVSAYILLCDTKLGVEACLVFVSLLIDVVIQCKTVREISTLYTDRPALQGSGWFLFIKFLDLLLFSALFFISFFTGNVTYYTAAVVVLIVLGILSYYIQYLADCFNAK